jgi:hypothetical protein
LRPQKVQPARYKPHEGGGASSAAAYSQPWKGIAPNFAIAPTAIRRNPIVPSARAARASG